MLTKTVAVNKINDNLDSVIDFEMS